MSWTDYSKKVKEHAIDRDRFFNDVIIGAARRCAKEAKDDMEKIKPQLHGPRNYGFEFVDTEESCKKIVETFKAILPATVGVSYKYRHGYCERCVVTLFNLVSYPRDSHLRILAPGEKVYKQKYYCEGNCGELVKSIKNIANINSLVWVDSSFRKENNILYVSSVARYKYTWSWLKSFF